MTNFIVLEKKYGLLKNIASYNDVLNTLIDFSKNSRKAEWINKLVEYNNSVGDTNTLITDIIKRL